jgi:uncharacterized protein (DUF885 family)
MDRSGDCEYACRHAQRHRAAAAITQALLPQMRALRASSTEASIYYSPAKHFPASFSAAEQKQLATAYRSAVEKGIAPALNRLVHFLETEYLPASRASTGWSALPNGAAWYAARIKDSTNLPLQAEAIHALGLKEVARIQQQMAEVAPKLGYTGRPICCRNGWPSKTSTASSAPTNRCWTPTAASTRRCRPSCRPISA